jgi:hypothetical protein
VKSIGMALSLYGALAWLPAMTALAQEDARVRTAERLMQSSRLAAQLRGLPAQMEADFRQSGALLDQRLMEALLAAARTSFQPETLELDITNRIAKKLTITDMNAALAWLESPAGQRISRAEELGSTDFDASRYARYVASLREKQLSEQRGQMLAAIVAATNGAEAALATQEAIALGVAVGMDTLQPAERRLGEATLRVRVRQAVRSEEVRSAIAEQLPPLYAYFYRDVADPDLAAYVRFLGTTGGKRYQEGMTAAYVESLGRASIRAGELAREQQRRTSM